MLIQRHKKHWTSKLLNPNQTLCLMNLQIFLKIGSSELRFYEFVKLFTSKLKETRNLRIVYLVIVNL